MFDWVRAGAVEDRIASIALRGTDKYFDAVQRIFLGDVVPYSGIVQTPDGSYEGEVIEKACYRHGGLLFLSKADGSPDIAESEFPLASFKRLILNLFRAYLAEIDFGPYEGAAIDASWAVCQRAGDYGTLHNHLPPGYTGQSRFSGIMYLAAPASINAKTFPNGCLYIVAGKTVIYFPPVQETVLFWPSDLLHGIHPFRGNGDRLAVAFDIVVH